jgi:serine/threonine protein kinase/tetratricopeptide (TPR) repeat protein
MTPDRWRQIEALWQAASDRTPQQRDALLAAVDPDLRREVESLLARHSAPSPLDGPPSDLDTGLDATATHMPTESQLGPYRIEAQIGAGGMGQVYRATDTRLGRPVAVKISHARFSDRFRREARAISALNHPHICALYDIGSQDGVDYVVMEYVEGRPLKGPLPAAETLRLAIQIASALEAAHEKGILHRDLKPGNILLAKSGVKLLDFGLAKFVAEDPGPGDATVTAPLTAVGQVLGTPAYMSPEQIEGKPADARSDIFAFGLVLYELASGRRAFQADTRNGLMAAILREQPAPLKHTGLRRVVEKCLAKDPANRWQTAAELRRELERIARPRAWLPWTAAGLALLVAAYTTLHASPKLTDKDTIVLADFTNTTADPVFDGALRQGLSIQLEQSPFLSLVPDRRIHATLSLMGQSADARLTPKIARDLCQRVGSAAVLEGRIESLGSAYVLSLTARSCQTGDVLDEEQAQSARKEDVLNTLSRIAGRFRSRIGESLATVEKHSMALPEATTSSLDALKAYSDGMKLLSANGDAAATSAFKRATEIDPGFAMAWARLGLSYGDVGETTLAAENFRRAKQLRDRASDRERFFIDALYDLQVTGNLERAQRTCQEWERTYPRENDAHGFLSAMIYVIMGKYPQALEESEKLRAQDPNFAIGYLQVAFNDVYMNRMADSDRVLKEATARGLEIPEMAAQRYANAFLKGDRAAMDREIAAAQGKPDVEDWLTDLGAFTLAYEGRLSEARTKSRAAAEVSLRAGQKERAAELETGPALWEAFFGNTTVARHKATDILALSTNRDVEYGVALALALAGDSAAPRKIASDMQARFPEDTAVHSAYLPVIEAALALNRREPGKAVEALEPASDYELGTPPSSAIGFYGNLYPVYIRGLAYLDAGHGPQAAAEFRRIIENRRIVWNDPIGALAHRQLGKALATAGDPVGARAAYNDFFTLWKNADPDIPVLREARAEYARLP